SLNTEIVFQRELPAAPLSSQRRDISILCRPVRGCYVSGWRLFCLQFRSADAVNSGRGSPEFLRLLHPRYLRQIPDCVCRLQVYALVFLCTGGGHSVCAL